jgi:hypothetical protein
VHAFEQRQRADGFGAEQLETATRVLDRVPSTALRTRLAMRELTRRTKLSWRRTRTPTAAA